MADNVGITTGADATVATDEISGKHHQRVKLSVGADGSAADMPNAGDGLGVALPAAPMLWDGSDGAFKKQRTARSIGDGEDGVNVPSSAGLLWNGSGYDRERNNISNQTLLASATRTAEVWAGTFRNYNARGLMLTLDVTSVPASAATLDVYITLYAYSLNAFGAAAGFSANQADGVGCRSLICYPGATDDGALSGVNSLTKVVSLPVTPWFAPAVIPSDGQSWTYGLYASYIN